MSHARTRKLAAATNDDAGQMNTCDRIKKADNTPLAPILRFNEETHRSKNKTIPKQVRYDLENSLVGLCNVWFEDIKPHLVRNKIKLHVHMPKATEPCASGDFARASHSAPDQCSCNHLDPGAAPDVRRRKRAGSAAYCSTQRTALRAPSPKPPAPVYRQSPRTSHSQRLTSHNHPRVPNQRRKYEESPAQRPYIGGTKLKIRKFPTQSQSQPDRHAYSLLLSVKSQSQAPSLPTGGCINYPRQGRQERHLRSPYLLKSKMKKATTQLHQNRHLRSPTKSPRYSPRYGSPKSLNKSRFNRVESRPESPYKTSPKPKSVWQPQGFLDRYNKANKCTVPAVPTGVPYKPDKQFIFQNRRRMFLRDRSTQTDETVLNKSVENVSAQTCSQNLNDPVVFGSPVNRNTSFVISPKPSRKKSGKGSGEARLKPSQYYSFKNEKTRKTKVGEAQDTKLKTIFCSRQKEEHPSVMNLIPALRNVEKVKTVGPNTKPSWR